MPSPEQIEQELAELKKVAQAAQADRLRQEARLEQLTARREELLARLQNEFDCASVQDAKARLESSAVEHAAKLRQIQEALKEVSA